MNEFCINTKRGNYLEYYWEEIKGLFKNFLKIYHEFLNGGESMPEPTETPSNKTEQKVELPKYLWI